MNEMHFGFWKKPGEIPKKENIELFPANIMIKMPDINQTGIILEQINTGALESEVFKEFSAKEENGCINIILKNTRNTDFCIGFLIALSDTIKSLLDNPQNDKVSFYIEGKEAASVAVCLASYNLWAEQYLFADEAQEAAFKNMHEEVKKAILQGKDFFVKELEKRTFPQDRS